MLHKALKTLLDLDGIVGNLRSSKNDVTACRSYMFFMHDVPPFTSFKQLKFVFAFSDTLVE